MHRGKGIGWGDPRTSHKSVDRQRPRARRRFGSPACAVLLLPVPEAGVPIEERAEEAWSHAHQAPHPPPSRGAHLRARLRRPRGLRRRRCRRRPRPVRGVPGGGAGPDRVEAALPVRGGRLRRLAPVARRAGRRARARPRLRRRVPGGAAPQGGVCGRRRRRLRLALDGLFDQAFAASAADHLASWLAAAAARGVERLELHLPRSRHAVLPPSLLGCTSLTSMTLRLDHYVLPLPSLSALTRLSRLHLASVSLAGNGDFFGDLISGCTELRCLILEQCHIGALRLAGPSRLCSLVIKDCSWTQESSVAVSDMPELRTIRYSGEAATRHIVDGDISLDEVRLAIEKPQVKPREATLRELITLVGNVRSLLLSPWCMEQFAHPEEWSKGRLGKVKQLSCIIGRREEGALSVAPLLSNCPNVEELCVSVVPTQCKRRRCSDDGEFHRVLGRKGATMKRLRGIRMEYIDESKSGFELVKVLLKNAPALEMMTIVPSMDGLEQAMFRRRVLKLRKNSRNASIQFSTTG